MGWQSQITKKLGGKGDGILEVAFFRRYRLLTQNQIDSFERPFIGD
jgi:hypothetical protein